MRKLRVSMLCAGGCCAFISAGIADGEALLGVNNGGIITALCIAAVLLAAPAMIHLYNKGRF